MKQTDNWRDTDTISENHFTVFVKPWQDKNLNELAELVHRLGFDGVELPVRKNCPVTPQNVADGLPQAKKIFENHGLKIGSVAGDLDERIIVACVEAGIPLLRIMVDIDMDIGYRGTEERLWRKFDGYLPLLERSHLTIGVQNHCGVMVNSSIGLMHLIERYDPRYIGAILDAGHCGLAGESIRMAVDITWSHLVLVNLKNAYWERNPAPCGKEPRWDHCFTRGNLGFCSWPELAEELKTRGYGGDLCLSAEYSDSILKEQMYGDQINDLVEQDLHYARILFKQ